MSDNDAQMVTMALHPEVSTAWFKGYISRSQELDKVLKRLKSGELTKERWTLHHTKIVYRFMERQIHVIDNPEEGVYGLIVRGEQLQPKKDFYIGVMTSDDCPEGVFGVWLMVDDLWQQLLGLETWGDDVIAQIEGRD